MTPIVSSIRWAKVRLTQDQAGFTLPELLIAVLIVGLVSGAIATSFLVGSKATADGKTRLDESHDAQQAAAYFTADASNASYFRPTTPPTSVGVNCQDFNYGGAGGVNVGLFEWAEGAMTKTALYGIPAGADKIMVRRYCENSTMVSEVKLTRHIGSTNPVVTCPAPVAPFTTCNQESGHLELAIQEKTGYDYTLRADPRPTATTPGGLLGDFALYIGAGGFGLGGNSVVDIQTGGIAITEGPASCNGAGSNVNPPEALYSEAPPPSPNACSSTPGQAPADPLASIPEPAVQPATITPTNAHNSNPSPNPPNSTLCGSTQPTYQPGTYDFAGAGYDHLKDACLESGIYYFTNGARLTNVTSAPGGVLIFVADGGLVLEGANLTARSTGPQAGITIFMGRTNNYTGGNSSTEDGQMYSNGAANVGGIVYGPAHPDGTSGGSKLRIQSNNGALTAKALNFYQMVIQGNGVGAIIN